MHVEDKKMREFVDRMKDSAESMQEAMKILSLGLDYRRFTKLRLLAPLPTKALSGLILILFFFK